jgi:hypothetical protein
LAPAIGCRQVRSLYSAAVATTASWTGVPYLNADELARVRSVDEFEPLARDRMESSCHAYVAGWRVPARRPRRTAMRSGVTSCDLVRWWMSAVSI